MGNNETLTFNKKNLLKSITLNSYMVILFENFYNYSTLLSNKP